MAKAKIPPEKSRLHIRNRNRDRYDLDALLEGTPALVQFVKPNKFGNDSIDFSNPEAVKVLNQALLRHYYDIDNWEFPDINLCPPIPGRADYLHYMADILAASNLDTIPTGKMITGLDIGVGASCIYPIIGVVEYGWQFMGSDIDPKSIASSEDIISSNPVLQNMIRCILQKNQKDIFKAIISEKTRVDFTICNPPFHASKEAAASGTRRKIKNLTGKSVKAPRLNFAGNSNELIYDGGEYAFIQQMVQQSALFSKNCFWFSTLVSKKEHVRGIVTSIKKIGAFATKTIPTGTGNKSSRIIAWTFLTQTEQDHWRRTRWND